jgi:hypothetical protein
MSQQTVQKVIKSKKPNISKDLLKEAIDAGMKKKEIAEYFGVTTNTINKYIRKFNLKKTKKPITEEEKRAIESEAKKNKPVYEIANELGLPYQRVYYYYDRANLRQFKKEETVERKVSLTNNQIRLLKSLCPPNSNEKDQLQAGLREICEHLEGWEKMANKRGITVYDLLNLSIPNR